MRRPRARAYHQLADINITNLVDVVLVLLIIFMISAPLLQSGIEVDLPKTTAAPIEQEAEGVVVTIDKKGGIYIDDVWSRLDDFSSKLDKEMKLKHTKSVYLRSDSTVAYGVAIAVIGQMKEMGIEQIGLVTAQAERAKRNAQKK
ncbi:protein TolR [candidate division GN15 bacterium]|uniref:Protein TolR n=1 Tax=candidate division GN15 bacterium TaxID=2072418 RepID=A0A855X5A5_9BACT|nr:MAG: protein TolR [candidate division GN15 bacterium]